MNAPKESVQSAADRLGPVLGFMRSLWEVDHALASASKQMKRRLGISGPERLAIRIVGEVPDISPGELAEILHVDPSSLTGLLKRMVRRKLMLRRADAADSRKAHLRLTADGEALDRLEDGTVEAGVHAALDLLAPRDVATAVVVLGALSRSLHAVAAKPRSTATAAPRATRRKARRRRR